MDEHVWVEVEVDKGTGALHTYRGRMARATYDAWCDGSLTAGAMLLEEVWWTADDPDLDAGFVYVVPGHTTGPLQNFSGRFQFRVDTVLMIAELRDGHERDLATAERFVPRTPFTS